MNHTNTNRLPRFLTFLALPAMSLGVVLAFAGVLALAGATGRPPSPASPRGDGIRIGIYDSRAVTVAYVRSELSARILRELLTQCTDAEKAGDAARVKELNAQGEALQVRRHLQGFSTAPIDDILDTVRDRLPQVARDANIVSLTRAADWHDAAVELVDVTDQLVALFNPDEQTLKMIADVRNRRPEPIEVVARIPAKN